MRLLVLLLTLGGAIVLSVALYQLSGGRLMVLALPLVFVGPLVWRRPRR